MKSKSVKPWITGYAFVREASKITRLTVRVPVDTKGSVPQVPYVIKVDKDYFVRTSTNPLEYTSSTFKIAEVL